MSLSTRRSSLLAPSATHGRRSVLNVDTATETASEQPPDPSDSPPSLDSSEAGSTQAP